MFKIKRKEDRRGAAIVEFAIVVPILVALLIGIVDVCQVYDASERTIDALRQAARLAGMNRDDILLPGETINERIETDLRNLVTVAGLNGDEAIVQILDYETGSPIDLGQPESSLALFELRITIPLDIGFLSTFLAAKDSITESIVFRNVRGVLVN